MPTSAEIDEAKCKQIGLPRCPFDITTLPVSDGRKTGITNSGFGTVFAVSDGKPAPVCDYAGFAPFGFGYRRCPGEQLTIDVFADFLRKVWRDKIVFHNLNQPRPGRVPVGPGAVIDDDIGFSRGRPSSPRACDEARVAGSMRVRICWRRLDRVRGIARALDAERAPARRATI